jgi:hypothetical protein
MRRFLFSTIIAFLTVGGLFAQDIKFGVRGGLNLPNLMAAGNNTPLSEGYNSRLAPAWGLFTELPINSTFSFRFGAEYSGMGGKKNGMQAMPTGRLITELGGSLGFGMTPEQQMALGGMMMWSENVPYYYADIKNTVKFEYVMIPLLLQAGRNIGTSPFHVYVNAGPFVSFLLAGKQASKGTSKMFADASGTNTLWGVMPDEIKFGVSAIFPEIEHTLNEPVTYGSTNITGELKSANLGVNGNIGIRYKTGRNYLFIEAGGNYGFRTVQDNTANGSNRIGAASVMAGYAFSLF